MVINTNVSALSSSRLLAQSSSMLEKSLARLSSGSKLVNPEDDAAGLAVSMRFDAQINRTSATIDDTNTFSLSRGNNLTYTINGGGTLLSGAGNNTKRWRIS